MSAAQTTPLVGVIMGSKNDYAVMRAAVEILREFGVPHEARRSSPRTARPTACSATPTPPPPAACASSSPEPAAPRTCPAWSPRAPCCPSSACPSRPPRCRASTRCSPSCRCPRASPSARSPSAPRARPTPACSPCRSSPPPTPRCRQAHRLAHRAPRRGPRADHSTTRRGLRLSNSTFPVLLPGATIGIFGGGQLGRLTAMAARTMGYRIHVLDPDPGCPARFVVDQCVEADWTDAREAARLARACDVVTLEIEQISLASLNAAASYAPVRPSESVLEVIQDRIVQKDWLRAQRLPRRPLPRRALAATNSAKPSPRSADAVSASPRTGGYDGRGQGKVGFNPDDRRLRRRDRAAWEALGEGPGVVEQAVDLDREISVLVARSPARRSRRSIPPRGTTTNIRSSPGASSPRRCPSARRPRPRAAGRRHRRHLPARRHSRRRAICNH